MLSDPWFYLASIPAVLLVPLAPPGVKLGHILVQRSGATFYYPLISFFLVILAAKLLWDGSQGLGVAL